MEVFLRGGHPMLFRIEILSGLALHANNNSTYNSMYILFRSIIITVVLDLHYFPQLNSILLAFPNFLILNTNRR